MYGPVRTVVWQGSVGDRRPYADLVRMGLQSFESVPELLQDDPEIGHSLGPGLVHESVTIERKSANSCLCGDLLNAV